MLARCALVSDRLLPGLAVLAGFAVGCGPAPGPKNVSSESTDYSYDDIRQPRPKREQLELASTVWPPFSNRSGNERVAVELVHTALQDAGYEVRTSIVGPDVSTDEHLRDETYDGSPAVWRTAGRERYLRFSKPFLENRLVLVARCGTDVSATSLAELEGKRVAIVSGYAYGTEVEQDSSAVLVEGDSTANNLRALLEEKVDYVLADQLVLHYLFELRPDESTDAFAVGKEPIARRTLHLAIRKDHPKATVVVEEFNRRIQQMVADGTYNEVLHLKWIRADADGDGKLELVLDGDRAGEQPPEHAYQVVSGEKDASSDVYFIEGQSYESWDAVPQQYEVPQAPTSSGHYGIGSPSGMQF